MANNQLTGYRTMRGLVICYYTVDIGHVLVKVLYTHNY